MPPGLLLGIEPDAPYESVEIPLPPGSVLALYTDGMVEAPGIDIDDAVNALARELGRTGPGTMNVLADALVRHARRSTPRSDDIALLLINPI